MTTRPAFVSTIEGELIAVRFNAPSQAANRAVLKQLATANDPKPSVMLVVVPHDFTPPDKATRALFADTVSDVYDHVKEIRVLHLGSGLRPSIARGLTTVMVLAAARRGQAMRVDKTIQEAAAAVAEASDRSSDALLHILVQCGVILADELRS